MAVTGNCEQAVKEAVEALVKWKHSRSDSEKSQLLSSDEFVYMVVTMKKIPAKGRTNPYKIPLVHPLFGDGSELCMFLDDRPDRLPTSKDAKSKIASESIPITKVIKLSKLKTDYKPFEAKRKLCDSYELFLADRRIIPLLPKHIGKHFYLKKKLPLAVDLEHNNWKEQVDRLCSSALLHLSTGTCCVAKVARTSMSAAEIVDNLLSAINGVAEVLPSKWESVRSLNVKFSDSVALPIYQSVPEVNLKEEEALIDGDSEALPVEGKKKRRREQVEDVKVLSKASSSSKKGRIHQVRYMDDDAAAAAAVDEVKDQVKKVKSKAKNDTAAVDEVKDQVKKVKSKAKNDTAAVDEVKDQAKKVKSKAKKAADAVIEVKDQVKKVKSKAKNAADAVDEGEEQVKKVKSKAKNAVVDEPVKKVKSKAKNAAVDEVDEPVKKVKSKAKNAAVDEVEEPVKKVRAKKKRSEIGVVEDVVDEGEEQVKKKKAKVGKTKTGKVEQVVDDIAADAAKEQVKKGKKKSSIVDEIVAEEAKEQVRKGKKKSSIVDGDEKKKKKSSSKIEAVEEEGETKKPKAKKSKRCC